VGDEIIAVNGEKLDLWTDFGEKIQEGKGQEMTVSVQRSNETLDVTLKPEYNEKDQRYYVGTYCKVSHNVFKGIKAGFVGTGRLFGVMFDSLKMILTGGASVEDIAGPVGIVQMVGQSSREGLWSYGFLMALICVNLAVINLLPLPALDGGRIIIVLFGWITGKKVSSKVEGIIHAVGLVLLLGLAVLVTFNDIGRLFG
jgi:regulator of sigma E protease